MPFEVLHLMFNILFALAFKNVIRRLSYVEFINSLCHLIQVLSELR